MFSQRVANIDIIASPELRLSKGIRVNQLAKELGVESKAILAKCRDGGLGEAVPNHMSVLSLGLAETVREWFKKDSGVATAIDLTPAGPKPVHKTVRMKAADEISATLADSPEPSQAPKQPSAAETPASAPPISPPHPVPSQESPGFFRRAITWAFGAGPDARLGNAKGAASLSAIGVTEPPPLPTVLPTDTSADDRPAPRKTITLATRQAPLVKQPPKLNVSESTYLCLVVDGLNVMWSGKDQPRLELLLSVLIDFLPRTKDLLCIFDANTRYVLNEEQSVRHADAYIQLLKSFSDNFFEAPAGMQADDLILSESNSRRGLVVSNDLFRNYETSHPLVNSRDRFLRTKTIRETLYVGGKQIPMYQDLEKAVTDLEIAFGTRELNGNDPPDQQQS